jgi:hypothetical protein
MTESATAGCKRSLLLTYLVIMTESARADGKALIINDLPGDHDKKKNQLELAVRRSLFLTYLVILTESARVVGKALIISGIWAAVQPENRLSEEKFITHSTPCFKVKV